MIFYIKGIKDVVIEHKGQDDDDDDDVNNWFTIDKASMNRIDELRSLKQMYGVIKCVNNCEYNATGGAKE